MNTSDIRVRFAPSPTGFLHIGGLRTALYNYLFARRYGGTTILRIEDTDRSRLVEGAVENLLETLHWAGISFDEGPHNGGPYKPYIQSERTAIYRQHIEDLLTGGKAYRCFCTAEELEHSRQQQISEKNDPSYNRRCRYLSESDVQKKLSLGLSYTVRLMVPLVDQIHFTDLIRGDITVSFESIDDQVLLKSDGYPTYHLANVIDDHLMRVTHVIRGEEWLPSTPKHLLLYDYFGWDAPHFAHLPLLLNPDRSKLSKRQGDVAVEDYWKNGYLSEALTNFVALLGWHPREDKELFTLSELEKEFNIDRVGKAGAIFDPDKLKWFNSHYLRALPPEKLLQLCLPWFEKAGIDTNNIPRCTAIIALLSNYLTLPSDIEPLLAPFSDAMPVVESPDNLKLLAADHSQQVLALFAGKALHQEEWTGATIKAAISSIQKESGVKGKVLYTPLRLALTGAEHGPDLSTTAEILGKEVCISRIHAFLS